MGKRLVNLNLGANLGWLQQGAGFGGRPVNEMTADLGRVRMHADAASYTGHVALVDNALRELTSGQPPASALNEISNLIRLFQSQAFGVDAAALNLGIVLGWLQQGARANNRPIAMATADWKRQGLTLPMRNTAVTILTSITRRLSSRPGSL